MKSVTGSISSIGGIVRRCLFLTAAVFIASANGQQTAILQPNEALQNLAQEIHERLGTAGARNVSVEPFVFQEQSATQIGTYVANRLTDHLVNIPNKRYAILSPDRRSRSAMNVTGELIMSGNTIRVHSRLIRANNGEILGSFNTTFVIDSHISGLMPTGTTASSGGGDFVAPDQYEPDAMSNPVETVIGTARINAPAIDRTLTENDNDFFLLVPDRAGRMTVETFGNSVDTYMHLYDENGNELASNDDGGEGTNARITRMVRPGERYIAMVRGYSGNSTGPYSFRAFIPVAVPGQNSFENPTPLEIGDNFASAPVTQGTLGMGGEAFYRITPRRSGPFAVLTTDADFDTYIEFYDAESNLIGEDDDGGEGTNARYRHNGQQNATYIVLVRGFNEHASGSYGIRAHYIEPIEPDQYEPDNTRDQAKPIRVGESQRRTFHSGSDEDWVQLNVRNAGFYIITASGIESNSLDTYLELYNTAGVKIAEDDDGGEGLSAMLRIQLSANTTYYIKVRTLTSEPEQGYILNVIAE